MLNVIFRIGIKLIILFALRMIWIKIEITLDQSALLHKNNFDQFCFDYRMKFTQPGAAPCVNTIVKNANLNDEHNSRYVRERKSTKSIACVLQRPFVEIFLKRNRNWYFKFLSYFTNTEMTTSRFVKICITLDFTGSNFHFSNGKL